MTPLTWFSLAYLVLGTGTVVFVLSQDEDALELDPDDFWVNWFIALMILAFWPLLAGIEVLFWLSVKVARRMKR